MDGRRYESTDGRGRVASGTKTENNAGAIVESRVWNTTLGMEEVRAHGWAR